jgi:hypothetical protein
MAKRKVRKVVAGADEKAVPLNVRVPEQLMGRMDRAAALLGTDRSHLLRMMLVEFLPAYEERAQRFTGGAS